MQVAVASIEMDKANLLKLLTIGYKKKAWIHAKR